MCIIFGSEQIGSSFQNQRRQHTLAANRKERLTHYCPSPPPKAGYRPSVRPHIALEALPWLGGSLIS